MAEVGVHDHHKLPGAVLQAVHVRRAQPQLPRPRAQHDARLAVRLHKRGRTEKLQTR